MLPCVENAMAEDRTAVLSKDTQGLVVQISSCHVHGGNKWPRFSLYIPWPLRIVITTAVQDFLGASFDYICKCDEDREKPPKRSRRGK